MNPDLQLVIVYVIVGATAVLLLRRWIRKVFLRGKPGCGSSCGCSADKSAENLRKKNP